MLADAPRTLTEEEARKINKVEVKVSSKEQAEIELRKMMG